MKETELLRAYSIANEKGFSRAGKHQKIILSQIMAYRKQCDGQNKSRFIINIFGEEGSGKEYLKSMLVNYLVIKRQLDGKEKWKEVMRAVDKVEVQ
jgi:pantothenate kinase-related protein Tda10